jgi:hypothetical protein
MHKIVEAKISDLLRKIEDVKLTNDDVVLVIEVLPEATIWLDHEVNVNWPVQDVKDVEDVLRRFAQRKVFLDKYYPSNMSPSWNLKGLHVMIRLAPVWSHEEGAACHLVQTGVETYPTYKLICSSGVSTTDTVTEKETL